MFSVMMMDQKSKSPERRPERTEIESCLCRTDRESCLDLLFVCGVFSQLSAVTYR
jgi:hypothetical protein